ncbi:ACT domain-containing protein [Natronospora cellulosivora (SeqCode)]
MKMHDLSLKLMGEKLAISKISSNMPIPLWVLKSRDFYSITRTEDEMSIISVESSVPSGIESEKGWRAIKIEGKLDFSLVGIISSITTLLADAGISVFVMSTFNTDYILIKETSLSEAKVILSKAYTLKAEA